MTVEDDSEDLYGVAPEDFLARRKELVAAAKKRGDADAAKVIGAARRPTTAAWVVNLLVRHDPTARPRLNELTENLRSAHATMDGARIRELSAAQRKLIDQLVRVGFAAAGVAQPSAALRDDVVGTLQAAIADTDVAARLGRLEKAERWSGFGDFGTVTAVGPAPRVKPKADASDESAARERRSVALAAAESAEAAHAYAVDVAAGQKAKLVKARRHYESLLGSIDAAEQALNTADEHFEAAEQAEREAADRLASATAALHDAEPR